MKWPSDLGMRSVRNADGGERMHVEVETHEAQGMPMPRRIRLDERAIEVAEVLDQWFGADYWYCKIRGDDGALYILRLDEKRFAWSLTLFTSAAVTAPMAAAANTAAPLITGRSVATGQMGNVCTTSVKTCELCHASYIGNGCSCRVTGGRVGP
jgi:hypothetical protein